MNSITGVHIHISGTVQGVGFRPFIYGLAKRYSLLGWVRNTSAGVDIHLDGIKSSIDDFITDITNEAPPLSRIDELQVTAQEPVGFTSFEIKESTPIPGEFQPISPDVSICPDCLTELFDPNDRRYRYPFINCTNCGPRFTIIEDVPYDRPLTTMATFIMCPACDVEYKDPLDRRFHAQPIACPQCGPSVWLETNGKDNVIGDQAIASLQSLLVQGAIAAIKGLGGFHLACDATNPQAVAALRQRKLRVDKPFAVMLPDIDTVISHCFLSDTERELLVSRERPIVILHRRQESTIVPEVAPSQDTMGVMLPYTPLHYLLFSRGNLYGHQLVNTVGATNIPMALVMTSGNVSEEPIAIENREARERLSGLADIFLMHNRVIRTRCDDSVIRVIPARKTPYIIRRSRGYAPSPIHLPWESKPILATGSELKNTFCLTRGKYAFISHHIGDMENYETLSSYEDGISHYERLFHLKPEVIAYDLHPNYMATRYALQRADEDNLPAFGIQHHHAHIAACMAENQIPAGQQVIGVAFDGTGYGLDNAIWGCEFLLADYYGFSRKYQLKYIPLPGSDMAIKKPSRVAIAYLWAAGIDWDETLPPFSSLSHKEWSVIHNQLECGINAPNTSSMGRLFDAVASLAGVRHVINYEAQAAIELEEMMDKSEERFYSFTLTPLNGKDDVGIIDPKPLLMELVGDVKDRISQSIISARFHNGVAHMVQLVCQNVRKETDISDVALSGGVWQNISLLEKTLDLLENDNFTVFYHRLTPANDGCISLGQATIAQHLTG